MASTNRDRHTALIVLLGSLAAAAVLLYALLFGPKLRAVERLKAVALARQADVSEAFRSYADMSKDAGEMTRWHEVLARFDKRVPMGPQQERFMAEFGALAVRRRLNEIHLRMSEMVSNPAAAGTIQGPPQDGASGSGAEARAARPERFAETRYQVNFTCAYLDLAELLDEIPRLERLVAIRSLQVHQNERRMAVALEISIFHRRSP